ncbi:hypothetical protein M2321_002614 [Rhodoblastus acidophilus]|nr:hypothetical protein [Rhodoblastus acidophilus]MCW2275031.1 hypothetical protein [Rhodoblastus acidophilus]
MSAGLILILAGAVAMNKNPPTANLGFILLIVGAALVVGHFVP